MFSRSVAVVLAAAFVLAFPATGSGATTDAPIPLTRWLGAEGGFDEIACWGMGFGCAGFGAGSTLDGNVGTRLTGLPYRDPDGVSRSWDARTGNRLFLAAVASAGHPSVGVGNAFLTTAGSAEGSFRGGAVSFAIMMHTAPKEPVVIFRHDGSGSDEVLLSLLPDGRLVAKSAGYPLGTTGATASVDATTWNTITMSYAGGSAMTPFKLHLNGHLEISAAMPSGAPNGDVSIGIVHQIASGFAIGIDDYVESPSNDAAIVGARVDYLMPGGDVEPSGWQKQYPNSECLEVAQPWQFVAEDQWVSVVQGNTGWTCNLSGTGLRTQTAGVRSVFATEGIPSRHRASDGYRRNLSLRPGAADRVLGVRTRIRATVTQTALDEKVTIAAGYVSDGASVRDGFVYWDAGLLWESWGASRTTRPNGEAWDANSLAAAHLFVESGDHVSARRLVTALRLDFVWVPSL